MLYFTVWHSLPSIFQANSNMPSFESVKADTAKVSARIAVTFAVKNFIELETSIAA